MAGVEEIYMSRKTQRNTNGKKPAGYIVDDLTTPPPPSLQQRIGKQLAVERMVSTVQQNMQAEQRGRDVAEWVRAHPRRARWYAFKLSMILKWYKLIGKKPK